MYTLLMVTGCTAIFGVGVYVGVKWTNWAYARELKKIFPDFPGVSEQKAP